MTIQPSKGVPGAEVGSVFPCGRAGGTSDAPRRVGHGVSIIAIGTSAGASLRASVRWR